MIEPTNPGNIRYFSGCIGNNKGFCVFPSFEAGIFQIYKQLRLYYFRDNLKTISAIITRYAPPSENNTTGYINFLSKFSGLPANQILTETDLIKLIPGIIKMESGTNLSLPEIARIISNANPVINFSGSNLAILLPFILFAAVWMRK
jgi:hypothetical protein